MELLASIAGRAPFSLSTRALVIAVALALVATTTRTEAVHATVPPALIDAAVRADVAARANVSEDAVTIARTAPVTWTDGCLGVYTPQTACTLALVDGFAIWAVAGGAGYRYHSDLTTIVFFSADGIDPASIGVAPLPGRRRCRGTTTPGRSSPAASPWRAASASSSSAAGATTSCSPRPTAPPRPRASGSRTPRATS